LGDDEDLENPFEPTRLDDRGSESVANAEPTANDFAAAIESSRVADNPFAAPVPSAGTSAAADHPFGADVFARPTVSTRSTADVVRFTIVGVISLALIVVGIVGYRRFNSVAAKTPRSQFENPDRNYRFYFLENGWKKDEARATRAGFDLAFHRPDAKAWITIRTDEPRGLPPLVSEVADKAAVTWKDRAADYSPYGKPGKTSLAGQPAEVISGEGSVDGLHVRCQTVCMVHENMVYEIGFEAPKDRFDELERDFTLARQNFELISAHTDRIKPIAENDLTIFASKKYPYRLQAPTRYWREVPELQTDSRFDDLKMLDRHKLGELTVSARKDADSSGKPMELAAVRASYLTRQKLRYENKVRERASDATELQINNREALRLGIVVTTPGNEEYLLYTTFIKGDGLIFTVQGRAPAEKRDVYEPIFSKIVDTFEVLDKVPESAKEPVAKKGPMEEPKLEPKEIAKAVAPSASKESPTTPEPAKMGSSEPKKAPEAPAKKATEAPSKRKSLDDLDSDEKPMKKKDEKAAKAKGEDDKKKGREQGREEVGRRKEEKVTG
jgi:hypothetical protein